MASPLISAATDGNAELVLNLLRAGADPDYEDSDGYSALAWAVFVGHLPIVLALLEHGCQTRCPNSSLLMWAVCSSNSGVVQALLEAGQFVHGTNTWGDTALMWAAREGDSQMIGALLEAGSPIDVQNMYGHTALMGVVTTFVNFLRI